MAPITKHEVGEFRACELVLSLDEFLGGWEMMPQLKRAELIGGIVYMPSPTGIDHGQL